MHAIILKCRPNSMYHFGQVAIDADTSLNDTSIIPHSDTIFSAMINLAARIFSEFELNNFLNLFGVGGLVPKIKISSGFYCLENSKGGFLYFLPKPISFNLEKSDNHKDLKKVQFISKSVWENGLKPSEWDSKCIIIDKKFVVTLEEAEQFHLQISSKLFSEISLPKVAVHKKTKEDSIYYQTNIQIVEFEKVEFEKKNRVHFYFLLEKNDLTDQETQQLNTIINFLPFEGIGGERSTGCGLFDGFSEENFEIKINETLKFISVSLINPNSELEFKSFENYLIKIRGGRRIGDSEGKFLKKVNMISEGAVINSKVRGRIVSISPQSINQPYLRNGICLALPYPKIV